MGDVSSWSPVDESNTSAPPNGWPEGQATNTVNNCGRMMMGAVRRFYDQLLAGALTLAGLNVSGTVSAGNITTSGNVTADGAITANGAITAGGNITSSGNVYATGYFSDNIAVIDSTGGAVLVYKKGGGWGIQLQDYNTFYDNGQHLFRNQLSVNTLTIDQSGNTVVAGNITCSNPYAVITADSALIHTSIICNGTIDAANYTRLGAPVFAVTAAEFAALEARIAALENRRIAA